MTPSQQASLAAILLDLRAGQSLYWAPCNEPSQIVRFVGPLRKEGEWCAVLVNGSAIYLYGAKPSDFIVGARVEIPE